MREAKLGAAVGKKGIGKSYTTDLMIHSYVTGNSAQGVPPRRALILDVNDEYAHVPAIHQKDVLKFSMHPTIELRRIRPYRDDGRKMSLGEIQDVLLFILENYRNGLLLIEDINRYISDNLPNDLVGAICTNRHSDQDIIMHFQSIGRITPKIWQNLNWIRFHQNSDSVDRHKNKFEDKHEMLKLVELIVADQYYKGNKRFYLYVDIDEQSIKVKDQALFRAAATQYVSENYHRLIAPLVNNRRGNEPQTVEAATEQVISRLEATYL